MKAVDDGSDDEDGGTQGFMSKSLVAYEGNRILPRVDRVLGLRYEGMTILQLELQDPTSR